jgi:hypothetical protein
MIDGFHGNDTPLSPDVNTIKSRMEEAGDSRVCLMIASDNTISTTHAELPPASFIFIRVARSGGRYTVSSVHLSVLMEPI